MSSKNRTRRTTTRNIRFPNQIIEQINIARTRKMIIIIIYMSQRASTPSNHVK
nr:hypothetical protein [Escherichia coli]